MEFFWNLAKTKWNYFDLYLTSSYNGLSNVFVGHAPFFKSLTHLTHKHKKSLSQKAPPGLDCICKKGSIGIYNLWAHNLFNLELPTTWCSVLHTTKQHPPPTLSYTHTLAHHYLSISLTILLHSMLPYTPLQTALPHHHGPSGLHYHC